MKKIWHKTWIYKTYNLFKTYFEYKSDKSKIRQIFYSKDFALILKKYLNIDVRKDWIGRLYGVINPVINQEGFLDISNSIIEIDGDNTNSNTYTQIWVYKQLELIKNLFNIHDLYNYIDVDIQKVGPINLDNYLVIFDIVGRKEYSYALKRWLKISIFYIILIAAIICAIIFI
ncbi:MAG: hypothetical protein J1F35_03335 [Erysipelotrichales bacterium]|nr:hypothetical protein [Erysipelotrichales bacterium]